MRVAHLIETDGPGGAERIVADLASTLQAAGWSNVVFVPKDGEGWLAAQLEGSGVSIEHFVIERPLSLSCLRQLTDAFRRHRIDVAHSHEFSMAVYGAAAARRAGIPHVITMHGGRYYAGRLQRRLALRMALSLSGRTVAVSQELAGALSRDLHVPRSRIRVIMNGVRAVVGQPSRLREELRLAADDRLLLSVGNLYPVKGHEHIIDALAHLGRRHSNVHLAISGRGDLAQSLAERAAARGIAERVHLLGLRSDVQAILREADLFVLPSLNEGLPLALLEAMFAERPIIASAVGEVRKVLDGGAAGVLVAPGDSSALASAIDALLGDVTRAAALASAGRRRAEACYSLRRMAHHYARTYRALVRRARRPSFHAAPPIAVGGRA